jgi:hypothetical protein
MRCEKKLKCGHRCPGLFGEVCLQGCCVHPKCRDKVQKAKPHLMEQVRLCVAYGSQGLFDRNDITDARM